MKTNFSKISGPGEEKWSSLLKFISFLFTKQGFGVFKGALAKRLQHKGIARRPKTDYNYWIRAQQEITPVNPNIDAFYNSLKIKPRIKIIVPALGVQTEYLQATRASILAQLYSNFDEVIFADAPTYADIEREGPVKQVIDKTGNDNYSIDYIFFVAPGCILAPNCLLEFVKHINARNADDIIYADEDHIADSGEFHTPYFKPDWSPDTFLSRNYIGDTFLVKKKLFDQLRGLPDDYEYNDCYDLLLRATEHTPNIEHVAQVLVHNRANIAPDIKNGQARKAIEAALGRRNIEAQVVNSGVPDVFHIKYEIKSAEKVSVIIPTKDNVALLKKAIDSIFQQTDYPDFEIIVLNNNSTSSEFFNLMKEYSAKYAGKFRCIDANIPFNFARLMNIGVAASKGAYILMCNNDIEVTHADWMTQMVSYAQHNMTGAVGVKLLYPDDTVQHAGIVSVPQGDTGHLFVGMDKNAPGYSYNLNATTNYSALTAACMMCRKHVYNEVGGMDENLAVEYNDIDLCLKFRKQGYYNVYLPTVELHHYESATRGHPLRSKESFLQHEKELAVFRLKWPDFIERDPFYSANVGLDGSFTGSAA